MPSVSCQQWTTQCRDAEDLIARVRDVNRLNREIVRLAVEVGDDLDTREWAMMMMLVARAFERIGADAGAGLV